MVNTKIGLISPLLRLTCSKNEVSKGTSQAHKKSQQSQHAHQVQYRNA